MLASAVLLLTAAVPAEAPRLPYDLSAMGDAPVEAAAAAPKSAAEGPKLQYALLDRLEWAVVKGRDGYAWDFSALAGGARDRLYVDFSGSGTFGGPLDEAEVDALYSRHVGSAFELNGGLRYDFRPRPSRAYATLGGQYDSDPTWIGAFAYFSTHGELGARISGYTSVKLVPRLFLQPAAELDWSAADVPALGVGRGLNYAEAGLRLRYEIREAFAPYFGVSWSRDLGRTARLDRAAGDDPETQSLVFGVRSSF
jgi:copper resistance protein B